jgi:hypothetical protein
MLYFDERTKILVGCDLKVFGGVVVMKCKKCDLTCRIKNLLVIAVDWRERA